MKKKKEKEMSKQQKEEAHFSLIHSFKYLDELLKRAKKAYVVKRAFVVQKEHIECEVYRHEKMPNFGCILLIMST